MTLRTAFARLSLLAAAMCLGTAATASPGDVNAQAFYLDARELLTKGIRAMFDKRTRPMMAQMKDAGETVRAENLALSAKGTPLYCVPEAARKKGMGAEAVIEKLGSLPQAQRERMTLKQAWRTVLIRDYPCR